MKNEFDYLNDIKMDFSVYEEEILTEKEKLKMKNAIISKKKIKLKKYGVIAACVGIAAVMGITVYASGVVDNIIRIVSTGNNEFEVIDSSKLKTKVPDEMKGLLFDENGEELTHFRSDMTVYDKDGNIIEDMSAYMKEIGLEEIITENGTVKISFHTGDEEKQDPLEHMKENYTITKNINDLENALKFDVKLPEYIPAGFDFHGAAFSGDEDEEYLFVYYMNKDGEYFSIHERIINEDTAYSMGAKSLEVINIKGNKAVLVDNREISWEEGGISIDINGRGLLERDELIKLAESVK